MWLSDSYPGGDIAFMKNIIRCIILMLLVSVAAFFSGELYNLYLTDFSEYPYWESSPQSNQEFRAEIEIVRDVMGAKGLRWFVVERMEGEGKEETLRLYCDEEIKTYLKNTSARKSGYYKTLFHSNVMLEYLDIENICERETPPVSYRVCVCEAIGEKVPMELFQDSDGFKRVSKKAGKVIRFVHGGIWFVIGAMALLSSFIQIRMKKREWLVCITNGVPSYRLLFQSILTEHCIWLMAWLFPFVCFKKYSAWGFQKRILLLVFLLVAGIIAMVEYFAIYRMNYKEALQRSKDSKRISLSAEAVRIVVLASTIMLVSQAASSWKEYRTALDQREFYSQFHGYKHLQIVFEEPDDVAAGTAFRQEDGVYADTIQMWNTIQWKRVTVPAVKNSYQGILANFHALSMLRNILGEEDWWNESALQPVFSGKTETFVVILPSTMSSISSSELEEILRGTGGYRTGTDNVIVRYYNADIKTYAFAGTGMNYEQDIIEVVNPIFLINAAAVITEKAQAEAGLLCDFTMAACKVTDGELKEVLSKYTFVRSSFSVDIYNTYEQRLLQKKRMVWACLFMAAGTMMINVLCVILFVRMVQNLESVEYAVLKVTGSPLIVRHQSILRKSVFAVFLGVIAAFLWSKVWGNAFTLFSLLAAAFLLALDILICACMGKRWENMQLIKVLKGGAL